jgi:hypothetical protein
MKYSLFCLLLLILFVLPVKSAMPTEVLPVQLWEVRSVDTMKTSRDLAREKLHDSSYDTVIERDLRLIKDLGANYVAIDTPYDDQFLPYLRRWVNLARKMGLKVWFRGNFSGWEGWFDYPKNMMPQQHIRATAEFIDKNSELFEDGDAFDPCPECENAQWWPQPQDDGEYNEFVSNQQVMLKNSFDKIGKRVHTNWTGIIGGRAREVLDVNAIRALDNMVAIDHYTNSTANMASYIDYFARTFKAKTLVSEFGAPIPDIHGKMSESQQADFIDSMMDIFYEHKENVYGLNYFALGTGTTEIIDSNGNPKLAYETIKKYYSPAIINGTVVDQLGQPISGVVVSAHDHKSSTTTNKKGYYQIVVPAKNTEIKFEKENYVMQSARFNLAYNQVYEHPTQLTPTHPSWIYRLRLWLKSHSSSRQ